MTKQIKIEDTEFFKMYKRLPESERISLGSAITLPLSDYDTARIEMLRKMEEELSDVDLKNVVAPSPEVMGLMISLMCIFRDTEEAVFEILGVTGSVADL